MKVLPSLSLSWVSHDGKIIVISKSLTTFAHAFIAILLGIYLADIGFTIIQEEHFFSIGVAGGAVFAPSASVAVILWQLRSLLSQMDVPPRDSYTMGILEADERLSMASMHVVGRNITGTIGPSTATFLWQIAGAGTPLIAGSLIKITYDVVLYIMFRNIKPK